MTDFALGYGTNGFANHRLDDALAVIADLGYTAVALTLDHAHLDPFARDLAAQVRRVAARLSELGLRCVVETGARYLLDARRKHRPTLVDDEPARRIEFVQRAVAIAADLGAECVSFWSGVRPATVDPATAWGRLTAGVAAVLEEAERRDVVLGFEPEPGMLVQHLSEAMRLRERLGAPARLGITLDVGHCVAVEPVDAAECVRTAAGLLVNVQLDDMRRGVHEHLPFGEGELDLARTLAALDETGYAGVAAVELPRHCHAAPEVARASIEALRAALAARPRDAAPTGPGAWGVRDDAPAGSGFRDTAPVGPGFRDTARVGPGFRDTAPARAGSRDTAPAGPGSRDAASAGSGARDDAPAGPGVRDTAPVRAVRQNGDLSAAGAVTAGDMGLDDAWLAEAERLIRTEPAAIHRMFPAVGRNVGRSPLRPATDPQGTAHGTVDDLARARLLVALAEALPPARLAAEITDLYRHGDEAERRGVLRGLSALPSTVPDTVRAAGVEIVQDALRTNDLRLVAAAMGPFGARCLDQGAWRHGVLKCLFTGVPLAAVTDLDRRTDAELVRMAADYAAELRAAGRPPPADLDRFSGDLRLNQG
jgi:L-ribulose-5-phosphate 3-epimerase